MSSYGDDPNQQQPYGQGHGQEPYGAQPTAPYGQQPAPGGWGGQPPTTPYGYDTAAHGPGGHGPGPAPSPKGFLGALFDLSFTTFVTPMIIKVVYLIGLIVIGLGTLFFALSGFFGDSPGLGIVTIVVAPLVGLLYLCLYRMMCEFYLAITRMSEDINRRLPRS
jgi:hypothetical protein